jgi:hypothetical protein
MTDLKWPIFYHFAPPPPVFLLSVERIAKLMLKKGVGHGGEGGGVVSRHIIIMIFGHLS